MASWSLAELLVYLADPSCLNSARSFAVFAELCARRVLKLEAEEKGAKRWTAVDTDR